jgi:hypothetical protein
VVAYGVGRIAALLGAIAWLLAVLELPFNWTEKYLAPASKKRDRATTSRERR